jgi:hypothetical protein
MRCLLLLITVSCYGAAVVQSHCTSSGQSLAFSPNLTSGNMIVVTINGPMTAVADTLSNSYIQDPNSPQLSSGQRSSMFYVPSTTGGADTVNISGTPGGLCIYELSAAGARGTSVGAGFSNTNTPTAGNVTISSASYVLIGIASITRSATWSATGGYSFDLSSPNTFMGEHRTRSGSAGTYSDGYSVSSTPVSGSAILGAFTASSGKISHQVTGP